MLKKYTFGFTLAELLISISVIALIASSTVVGYASVLRRSRDIKRQADMESIRTALDSFHADHDRYPGPLDGITGCGQYIGVGDVGESGTCDSGGSGVVTGPAISIDRLLAPYMGTVPRDPLHDPLETNSADGYGTEFYYAYDPVHTVACGGPGTTGPVLGFSHSEMNNVNLTRDTCSEADMQLNVSDYNIGL